MYECIQAVNSWRLSKSNDANDDDEDVDNDDAGGGAAADDHDHHYFSSASFCDNITLPNQANFYLERLSHIRPLQ